MNRFYKDDIVEILNTTLDIGSRYRVAKVGKDNECVWLDNGCGIDWHRGDQVKPHQIIIHKRPIKNWIKSVFTGIIETK